MAGLGERDRKLISLRYDEELSMEAIGRRLGVSRVAISKRLQTLHKKIEPRCRLTARFNFLHSMVYKPLPSVLSL